MTERTAMRLLWTGTVLAAAALVTAVNVFEARDEVLVYGTMFIIIVSSLTAGLVTGLDDRRDD